MAHAPNFSTDLVAIVDRYHARARNFLDQFPSHVDLLANDPRFAPVARLVVLDCLQAGDGEEMMYRLAGWEQLLRENLS